MNNHRSRGYVYIMPLRFSVLKLIIHVINSVRPAFFNATLTSPSSDALSRLFVENDSRQRQTTWSPLRYEKSPL